MKRLLFLVKKVRFVGSLLVSYVSSHRLYFLVGAAAGVAIYLLLPSVVVSRPLVVGITGNFTVSSLPLAVQNKISLGLTALGNDGRPKGAAAISWTATDEGKKVIFKLNTNLYWQDKEKFDARHVNYNLKGADLLKTKPDEIVFSLKEPFAPLPTVVTQPLFKSGLLGLGEWRVESVNFNGRFVSQIRLKSLVTDEVVGYKFYPTEQQLISAMKLGEITQAVNLTSPDEFVNDSYYITQGSTSATTIATIFFNTQKKPLDDKATRQALVYAIAEMDFGQDKATVAAPFRSWFITTNVKKYSFRPDLSGKHLRNTATESGGLRLLVYSPKALGGVSEKIAQAWRNVGVSVAVNQANFPPPYFDVFVGFLEVGPDPDQYALWHSTQNGNISQIKSPKIDKLLEEGRRVIEEKERQVIYADLQKALSEEVPAVFLFYPQFYTVKRR